MPEAGFAKELVTLYGPLAIGWVAWWLERKDVRKVLSDYHQDAVDDVQFKTKVLELLKSLNERQ